MALSVVSWRVGADNKLEIVGLENTLDLSHPTDATILVTVRNRAGAALAGLTSVPATYVSGTGADTIYRLVVDDAVVPPKGLYKAEAVATRSGVTGREFCIITVEEG